MMNSRRKRCPKCKKVRMKWLPANFMHDFRKKWEKDENGRLVCFLCANGYSGPEGHKKRMDEKLVAKVLQT